MIGKGFDVVDRQVRIQAVNYVTNGGHKRAGVVRRARAQSLPSNEALAFKIVERARHRFPEALQPGVSDHAYDLQVFKRSRRESLAQRIFIAEEVARKTVIDDDDSVVISYRVLRVEVI